MGIEVDLRDHEAVEALVVWVVQEWGWVDVLVAHAGGGRGRSVDTKASTLGAVEDCAKVVEFLAGGTEGPSRSSPGRSCYSLAERTADWERSGNLGLGFPGFSPAVCGSFRGFVSISVPDSLLRITSFSFISEA